MLLLGAQARVRLDLGLHRALCTSEVGIPTTQGWAFSSCHQIPVPSTEGPGLHA